MKVRIIHFSLKYILKTLASEKKIHLSKRLNVFTLEGESPFSRVNVKRVNKIRVNEG
jgi:hypothetical protein